MAPVEAASPGACGDRALIGILQRPHYLGTSAQALWNHHNAETRPLL